MFLIGIANCVPDFNRSLREIADLKGRGLRQPLLSSEELPIIARLWDFEYYALGQANTFCS